MLLTIPEQSISYVFGSRLTLITNTLEPIGASLFVPPPARGTDVGRLHALYRRKGPQRWRPSCVCQRHSRLDHAAVVARCSSWGKPTAMSPEGGGERLRLEAIQKS